MNRMLKRLLIAFVVSVIIVISSFYVFIVSGWMPKTQEVWVMTAMTTLSHKWLATSFIKEDTINRIMNENKVDDSGYVTNPELIVGNDRLNQNTIKDSVGCEVERVEPKDPYLEEGYTLMEEGIYIKDVEGTGWKGKLVLVQDSSRVDLVQTRYQWSRGDLIKTLVPLYNARLGVNAGGFVDPNYESNGGIPAGLLIIDGEVINSSGSARHSVIGINKDNVLVLGKMTKQEAIDANLRAAVDFRPFLIVNGEPMMKGDEQGGWGIAPRTAIGQRATGEMLFLVIDGRQPGYSIGVDLRVLQDTLMSEGAINAAMLDGGSSTVLYHAEKGYINKPSLGHERYINNCWIVK